MMLYFGKIAMDFAYDVRWKSSLYENVSTKEVTSKFSEPMAVYIFFIFLKIKKKGKKTWESVKSNTKKGKIDLRK